MHHQVGVGNVVVNGHNLVHGQDVTGGLAGELVGAMAGANGYRQSIDTCALHKVFGLHWVGEQHVVGQLAHGTDAVFFTGFTGFQ